MVIGLKIGTKTKLGEWKVISGKEEQRIIEDTNGELGDPIPDNTYYLFYIGDNQVIGRNVSDKACAWVEVDSAMKLVDYGYCRQNSVPEKLRELLIQEMTTLVFTYEVEQLTGITIGACIEYMEFDLNAYECEKQMHRDNKIYDKELIILRATRENYYRKNPMHKVFYTLEMIESIINEYYTTVSPLLDRLK